MEKVKYVLCAFIMAGVAYFAWQYFEDRGKKSAEIVRNTPNARANVNLKYEEQQIWVSFENSRRVYPLRGWCLTFSPSSYLDMSHSGPVERPNGWRVKLNSRHEKDPILIKVRQFVVDNQMACPWGSAYSEEDPRRRVKDVRTVAHKRWQDLAKPHTWKVIDVPDGQCISWGSHFPVYAQVMKTESNSWMNWDRYTKLILRDKPVREEISAIRFQARPQDKWGSTLYLERRTGKCVQKTTFRDSWGVGKGSSRRYR